MKTPCFTFLVACFVSVVVLADSRTAAAATITIQATGANKWSSGGASSNGPAAPLLVKVDKGDVLEISSAAGTHGFTTLADPGNHNPRPQLKLEAVQACGETRLDAAFRELECGPSGSRFNKKPLVGTLKLEVTDKFQGDVHFWCTQHERIMWGTIQPK